MRSAEKQRAEKEAARRALLEEYRAALWRLRDARAAFQQVTDPALISACIYEVNAAQDRCSYLFGRLQEEQISNTFALR